MEFLVMIVMYYVVYLICLYVFRSVSGNLNCSDRELVIAAAFWWPFSVPVLLFMLFSRFSSKILDNFLRQA